MSGKYEQIHVSHPGTRCQSPMSRDPPWGILKSSYRNEDGKGSFCATIASSPLPSGASSGACPARGYILSTDMARNRGHSWSVSPDTACDELDANAQRFQILLREMKEEAGHPGSKVYLAEKLNRRQSYVQDVIVDITRNAASRRLPDQEAERAGFERSSSARIRSTRFGAISWYWTQF